MSKSSQGMILSVQAEKASSKPQEKTKDIYCKTLQNFYEASKEDRKALRERSVSANKILETFVAKLTEARTKSGEKATNEMISKAMKNTNKKRQMAKTIDEKKEEKVNEDTGYKLPPKKLPYPHSVSLKFVYHQLPKAMDVVDRGISLKGLRTILQEFLKNTASFKAYIDSHREIGKNIRCPGEFLTYMLVKPETRISDCYIEHIYSIFNRSLKNAKTDEDVKFIEKESNETLGKVNVFVSHTWLYEFETLVESVAAWEVNWEKVNGKRHDTFYYFIDYFAVNQHNQEGDLSKLQEVVQESKVTCLVLKPWDEPIPFLRCWCIYEIAKTELYPSTRLNVAFPPNQVKRFKKNFFDQEGKKVRQISRIIENINSEKATASWPPDEIMIKNDIKKLGGFQKVNQLCIRTLRKWLIDQACEFADEEATGDYYKKSHNKVAIKKAYWVLKNVGTFLRHQGKFEKSIKYLKDAIRMMEGYFAGSMEEEDDEKVNSKDWFELSYNKVSKGLTQLEDVDERKQHKENFLKLLNSLANSFTDDQQYNEAEAIYRKTLHWRAKLLGWNCKPTRITQFNLGVCLIHQKQFKEAEKNLREVINYWPKDRIYRYWALFNLGDLKSRNFEPQEAVTCFEEACHGLDNICKVNKRDRFLSLAKVLWAQHLLRWAREVGGKHEERLLKDALNKAETARNNFSVNSDPTHPDARLAARTKRRIELRLNPKILKEKEEQRLKLMKEAYDRKWSSTLIEGGRKRENIIRVMQWNLLADKLAYPDFKKGGFGCHFNVLNWNEYRKDKVLAEIIKYDPDILVLVELDHYEDIRFVLQEDFQYESIWKKKNKNFYTDGTGIFWKKDRFKSGKIYKKPLMKRGEPKQADQVFVAVELKPAEATGENFGKFVVGGCHLKSTKKSKGELIRLDQCKQVMGILNDEFRGLPVVMGSDMNAEATGTEYEALAYPYFMESGMVSAYESVLGKEPPYTSWKFRIDEDKQVSEDKKVKEWKYTIDFIFHSKELKTLNILHVPEEREIDNAYGEKPGEGEDLIAFARRRCLLPNTSCPSDHLPILAEILLPGEKY